MMLATKRNLSPVYLRRRKSQAGQSVIIALAVLFLLGFLGALFSIIVVRNLTNSQNQNNTLTTDYFAQAGINYANAQLQTSALGADWRPPLQFKWTTGTPGYLTGAAYSSLPTDNASDPDAKWLDSGYTRYNLNGGRFLLRILYNPAAAVNSTPSATAKFLEIDSVGRLGTINTNDPTTYTSVPPNYRRTELVAYKPIGIVDYGRFITNKDNRTDTAALGVPSYYANSTLGVVTPGVQDIPTGQTTSVEYPLVTTYGSATAYTNLAGSAAGGGGTLRSNMSIRLYGENSVYLNTLVGDDWEVAGNILLDSYNAATAYNQENAQGTVYTPAAGGTAVTTGLSTQNSLYPSNDTTNFNTFSGAIRDGSTSTDAYGYPRSIRRLNPPVVDSLDPATGLSRYQALTGGNELQTQQYATTADYQPATVYINNTADIQPESTNFAGVQSLRDQWLDTTQTNWAQGFYSPPGAVITFGPVPAAQKSTDTTTPYGITITRNDGGNQFTSPGINPTSQVGTTLYLSYESPVTGQANPSVSTSTIQEGVGYLDADQTSSIPNDVVIYASGNVRVRGIVSNPADAMPKHITIVTNGIAYIDGSILKGNPQSSIAILARQYVCVNTSQFLAGAYDASSSSSILESQASYPTFTGSDILLEDALFGQQYTGTAPTAYQLYLTTGPSASTADITVNNGTTFQAASAATTQNIVVGLLPAPPIQTPFTLTFTKDSSASSDFILEKAAILPADIHIEAVLYAQNNSFFVIPGTWFNSDTSDNLSNYPARSSTTQNSDFPFYGQPIDMQITIDGAVAENIPADISDQTAWMQKWGWIPRYHGSDTSAGAQSPHVTATTGVGVGLNISYDYEAGFPYINSTKSYLRQDRFGRPLAFAPALPVSPDLLYSGQPPT